MPKKLLLTGARSVMFTRGLLADIIEENFTSVFIKRSLTGRKFL